nr:restriction endonuclease subunit S [Campylobacter concisus]
MANLEQEFKASGGKFEEFRIGDIFDIQTPKRKFDANKIQFGGQYPYVARGDKNNGIRGYINENTQYLNDENTISFGQDTATMFFQKDKYFTGDKIKIFKPINFDLNIRLANYIIASMRRGFSNFAWGSSSFNVEILKDVKILLPTLGGNINFSFMEKFIEELDAYLRTTGLKNYELTDAEKSALAKFDEFDKWGGVAKEFKIGDLFEVVSNPQLNKDSFQFSDDGEYPYFTRTVLNNGITGYVDYLDEKHKIKGNSLAVGMLGMQFFYMEKDFYAGQFTKTIYPNFDNFSKNIAQYFIGWLNKKQKFYQGSLVRDFEKLFKGTNILLPINENGEIDYEFMENFIKAIEKLVIKDVVLWADKKIESTKKVINKA